MILVRHKWLFKQVSASWLGPQKRRDNLGATCREAYISLPVSQRYRSQTGWSSAAVLCRWEFNGLYSLLRLDPPWLWIMRGGSVLWYGGVLLNRMSLGMAWSSIELCELA